MKAKEVDIGQSVDVAIVLGFIATKDLVTAEEKIAVLTQLGYSNADMARICGKTSDVVKTLKSRIKRGGKKNAQQ